MSERGLNDRERTIAEMRDELERELLHPSRAGIRRRSVLNLFSRVPQRTLPLLVGAAVAAGGVGIAMASDATKEGFDPPAELLGVTSVTGERIDFKCEADQQWFFDHIDLTGDTPLQDLPDPLPVPPEGICDGSPPLP